MPKKSLLRKLALLNCKVLHHTAGLCKQDAVRALPHRSAALLPRRTTFAKTTAVNPITLCGRRAAPAPRRNVNQTFQS